MLPQTLIKQVDSVTIVMECKMKISLLKIYAISILLIFITLIVVSCSDVKDDIAAPPEITTHGSGVFNPTSSDFHGKKVAESNNKLDDCKQCHASDFSGGIAKVSCATSGCHLSINVHKDGITDPASSNFHGKFIADNLNGKMDNCATCHGNNFHGGLASPTCANCHSTIDVHKDGITNPSSPDFHGNYIAENLSWDMRVCGTCHASDYSGGIDATSCLNCHTSNNGPEACNTCHGDFNDPNKIAPPRALNGSTSTTYAGVGAHTSHLYENSLGNTIRCSTCHKYPQSVYADGHLGTDGKAEITFGRLSIQGGVNPSYDYSSNNCSNTYCHGNFSFSKDSAKVEYQFVYTAQNMEGNNATVKWNKVDGTQAQCGSCHGLPPSGHMNFALTECYNCHYGVIDKTGKIIDPTKHINGVKNVFGN